MFQHDRVAFERKPGGGGVTSRAGSSSGKGRFGASRGGKIMKKGVNPFKKKKK